MREWPWPKEDPTEDDRGVEAMGAEGAEALVGVVPRPRLKGAGEMPVR